MPSKLGPRVKRVAWIAATAGVLLSLVLLIPAYSDSHVRVAVDGQELTFADVRPYIDTRADRTMVPARAIAEGLGIDVKWDEELRQVTFTHRQSSMILTVDQSVVWMDGKRITLDTPAVVMDNRTMVPLRFISEWFGARVDWIEERQLVLVTSSGKARKGTWIWDSTMILREQENLLQFALDNRVTNIYLHIDQDRVSQQAYQSFIRRAHELNMKVEALAGTPEWVFADQHHRIQRFIAWVAQYNASVEPNERFVGLHFDIEPYALEEWETDRQGILENWMDTIRFIEEGTKAVDAGFTLFFDIPFWIHKISIPGTEYSFSAWLLEKADGLVIMDYRNAALGNNGMIELAKPILREATTLNKQAVVAVDTAPSSEGDHTTFYSFRSEVMEAELLIAMEKLSPYEGYGGLAIHDYTNWRELIRRSEGGKSK